MPMHFRDAPDDEIAALMRAGELRARAIVVGKRPAPLPIAVETRGLANAVICLADLVEALAGALERAGAPLPAQATLFLQGRVR